MPVSVHQYRDRAAAGQILAQHLVHYANRADVVVLAVPHGGAPVALEVADYLHAPMDVFLVRKLRRTEDAEPSFGAVASGGVRVLDESAMAEGHASPREIAALAEREHAELQHHQALYRGTRPRIGVRDRIVILVDEGISTGFSMHTAVVALHQQQPAWVVVAAPVGSPEACDELAEEAHEVVCPLRPSPFGAIGLWYDHFVPLTDEDVRDCLRRAAVLPRM